MTANCKKIDAHQLAGINRYLKKIENRVDTKKSFYDSSINLWNIELEEQIDMPHHQFLLCKIAQTIMEKMEIENVCLEGVIYHKF